MLLERLSHPADNLVPGLEFVAALAASWHPLQYPWLPVHFVCWVMAVLAVTEYRGCRLQAGSPSPRHALQ